MQVELTREDIALIIAALSYRAREDFAIENTEHRASLILADRLEKLAESA